MDSGKRDEFAVRVLSTLTGGALTMLVSVGHRTGLFEAAARGPATSAFPASRFLGVDIDRQVLALAEAERARLGLGNAAFAAGDAAALPARPRFDLITAFDAVHDQHSPQQVLRRIRAALAPGGVFLMVDAKFASDLEGNVGNPLAALCYAISLLYCVPVSLAEPGGAGLGAMWGTEMARELLAEAGFGQVEVVDSPRPQNCIYICRP